jgi:uncharacterized membrane protein YgcG
VRLNSKTQTERAIARQLMLPLALCLFLTAPAIAGEAGSEIGGTPTECVAPAPTTAATVEATKPQAKDPRAAKSLAFNAHITNVVEVPTLATARSAFDRREFLVALKQFDKLHSQGMCNDTVHYYMARCYQQNSQVAAALQNYEAVIAKTHDTTLRYYAEVGHAQLARYSHHRTYQGNGNNFQHSRPGPASRGGGGGGRGGGGGG